MSTVYRWRTVARGRYELVSDSADATVRMAGYVAFSHGEIVAWVKDRGSVCRLYGDWTCVDVARNAVHSYMRNPLRWLQERDYWTRAIAGCLASGEGLLSSEKSQAERYGVWCAGARMVTLD